MNYPEANIANIILSLIFHYIRPYMWLMVTLMYSPPNISLQLNPLGLLLILWSDSLSDHTSLLSS